MWQGQAAARPEKLVVSGLNRYVRHPLYFATLLLLLGYFLRQPDRSHAITAALGLAYLLIGTRLEERKLVATFGQAYRDYQQKVPMLIPFKWR
jgi:protein-S-isoprenylcysteine O-methyltransferase Ste14